MGRTILGAAAVSLDGFIAHEDDSVDPLFDWLGGGDVEWSLSAQDHYPLRTTAASRDFMQAVYAHIGVMMIGRRLFDHTDGWGGTPPIGEHVVVVTHAPPRDWAPAETAPFTFVTEGIDAAIATAQDLAGDRDVDVAAGQVGGQALRRGLIDQVVMNVVPVVFGTGRSFFGLSEGVAPVRLGDPTRVVPGDRVTHLLFDVPPESRHHNRPASRHGAPQDA